MPFRRLPRTDDSRSIALAACKRTYEAIPAPSRLISEAQFLALQAALTAWTAGRAAATKRLAEQAEATVQARATFVVLVRFVSHFIQVLNFAIERGEIPAGARGFYFLPVSGATVPDINTPIEALAWAGKLAAGEALRIAEGGAALAWPSIAQVSAAAAACAGAEAPHSTAKSAFDRAQEAVAAQRPGVDAIIRDLWDTIEFHLREHEAPSLRRRARDWGVFYEQGEEENPPPAPPAPPVP